MSNFAELRCDPDGSWSSDIATLNPACQGIQILCYRPNNVACKYDCDILAKMTFFQHNMKKSHRAHLKVIYKFRTLLITL